MQQRIPSQVPDLIQTHPAAVLVCVVFALLATLFNLTGPVFEAPDEHLHYDFIRVLQIERRLPVVDLAGPFTEYHQPPLYYALAGLVTAPLPHPEIEPYIEVNPFWAYRLDQFGVDNKNQFLHDPSRSISNDLGLLAIHLTRGLSTVFGLLTLILVYALALAFLPKQAAVAVMALVAFIPNVLLTHGAVTNDSLVILITAASGLALTRLVASPEAPPWWVWAGVSVLLGLGLLTKLSAWPLLPVSALAVTLLALRLKSGRLFVIAGVILLGGVLLIGGWWIWRNVALYGDPTGLASMWAVWGERSGLNVLAELRAFRRSFWINFGYGNVPAPDWVYVLLDLFVIGGLLGLINSGLRGWRDLPRERRDQIVVLATLCRLTFGALLWYLLRTIAVTGRQLYPALPPLALGLVVGWLVWLPADWRERVGWGFSGATAACALAAWALIFLPAYRPAPHIATIDTLPPELQQSLIALDWRYSDAATLVAVDLPPGPVNAGDTVDVGLLWQVESQTESPHAVAVHLIDQHGEFVGKRDTYPGLGTWPTTFWPNNQIIIDRVPVPINSDAEGPILLRVEVVLYDYSSGERLTIRAPDGAEIGFPIVGQIKLADRNNQLGDPDWQTEGVFSGPVRLAGLDIASETTLPGESLELGLHWQSAGPLDQDYTIFVHLLSQDGTLVAQADGPPLDNLYPTTAWGADESFVDRRSLPLPTDLAAGDYSLAIGLYDPVSGQRLLLDDGSDSVWFRDVIQID
ncbi:MAG: hypothetical protein GYB68_00825 [Chloroflexi bacterium]|nr:hypothetical protein [Chloroflexota bacterium]